MVRKITLFAQVLAALPFVGAGILSAAGTAEAHAQATPRITGQVESSALVSLPGQVHPWARAQFDRGPAPASLNGRMLLMLRRSSEQESALQSLLASQQDPHSPNYHKWLTPDDFGKRFGVADSDLQTVTSYLSSRGMSVGRVYGNHMAIEVGATADQIRSTFQTEIHTYSVGGKTFYANSSAPKIPSALHSVVSGFAGLNNFAVKGGSGAGTQAILDPTTHTLKPLYSTGSGANATYGISPGDLARIYGIPAATGLGLGGANVNVGVLGDSNINVNYVNNYRSIFGLGVKAPIVVIDGNDPGVNDDAYIAYKQIELISAVAPNANIYYYTSADTDYDLGIYFALIRALQDNQVQVMVNGFQQCETALGSGTMEFINSVYEQAAAQGITVVTAAGNTGPVGCELPGTASSATTAYAVNGYATSSYVTAVGGTDFYYSTTLPITHYFNTSNSTTPPYTSAIATAMPIPEQVWNDSYPNYSNSNGGTSVLLAGGGGVSSAGVDGISTPQPIPAYQSSNAKAVAISNKYRIIPDVSFFAGSGANDTEGYNRTAYLFCMQAADCLGTTPQFTYSGGTEASSAVFAGAVALAVQKNNSGTRFGLGNVNAGLYAQLGAGIVAHDVTQGHNRVKCTGTSNCTGGTTTGYVAGVGYDAASGLGSFDITSFVTNYKAPNIKTSTTTLTITDPANLVVPNGPLCGTTPNCTLHGTYLTFKINVSGSTGTPTGGDAAIYTSSPLAGDQAALAVPIVNGTGSVNYGLLPGGTYKIYARYAGDSTFAPSVSTPYTITVKPEACKITVYNPNITTGTATSLPFGTPVHITAEPWSLVLNNVSIPSGSINVKDNGTLITTLPINSEGAATFSSNLLSAGSHSIGLSYSGDASYGTCQTPAYLATITKAATTTTLSPTNADTTQGNVSLTAVVQPTPVVFNGVTYPSNGTAPTGKVTFNTTPVQTATLVQGFDPSGNSMATASITVGPNNIPANGKVTATYVPGTDPNYNTSATTVSVDSSNAIFGSDPTSVSFTISDTNGITNDAGPYPTHDSLTLAIHVASNFAPPNGCANIIVVNCTQPYVNVLANGIVLTDTLTVDSNGNATFTLPQQNGYLALPSGQVQLSVIYTGYTENLFIFGLIQISGSSSLQTITINDDRTSADFSLQSDTTVNQASPLSATSTPAVTQASYNLRITSIYNFQSSIYSTKAINLSCAVVGFTDPSGIRSTPSGLTCGFNSAMTTTTVSPTFAANSTAPGYITQTLYVGAAPTYAISSNSVPAQPANRWWLATGGTTLACIFLLGLPGRRRNWQSMLGACVIMIVSFGITGCGATVASGANQSYYDNLNGGPSGTPAVGGTPVPKGTYTVLVTATTTTNTTLVHTLPINVVVGTGN